MGLFESLFGKKETLVLGGTDWKTLTTYQPTFRSYSEKLYESELVAAAIDARARHFSKMRVEFIGPAKAVFKTAVKPKPNSWQTWSQFLYRLSVILDMQGTACIIPVLDEFGQQVGIFPVLPSSCQLWEYSGTLYLRYTFRDGKKASIEFEKVGVMTSHQYEHDIFGTRPEVALKGTLAVSDLNRQGIKEYIKSSATYRFWAQVSNFTKADDLKKERQRFTENNLSGEDSGLLLFPNTYSNIKQVEAKNYILDEKQMEYIRKSVYDYFGVSEEIIQNRASREVFESFYEGAIEPLAIQFCQVMTNVIYTPLEQSFGNEVSFYSNKLQRLSIGEQLQAFDRGLLTINEARGEVLGLPPIDGGDVIMPRGEYYGREGIEDKESEDDE